MLFRGVGRLETELTRDLGTGRGHAGIRDKALNEPQNLRLAGGQIGRQHVRPYLFIRTVTVIISRSRRTASGTCRRGLLKTNFVNPYAPWLGKTLAHSSSDRAASDRAISEGIPSGGARAVSDRIPTGDGPARIAGTTPV
jgi:hypothetical protein